MSLARAVTKPSWVKPRESPPAPQKRSTIFKASVLTCFLASRIWVLQYFATGHSLHFLPFSLQMAESLLKASPKACPSSARKASPRLSRNSSPVLTASRSLQICPSSVPASLCSMAESTKATNSVLSMLKFIMIPHNLSFSGHIVSMAPAPWVSPVAGTAFAFFLPSIISTFYQGVNLFCESRPFSGSTR